MHGGVGISYARDRHVTLASCVFETCCLSIRFALNQIKNSLFLAAQTMTWHIQMGRGLAFVKGVYMYP